jgi:NadR type nicotinamide-nucleotide adenylyltransferase
MQEVKKVVIIGPESTGKSTLSELLATYYNTLWCPEYAREYLLTHGTHYTYNDLLTIAKGQLQLEDEYMRKLTGERDTDNIIKSIEQPSLVDRQLLFVDTDMYVMKVWCEYVFNNCHPFILEKIVEQKTDLYLLCNIDLPWVKDELREYPDLESREELYHIYKDILGNQNVPWVNISGTYEQRLQTAIRAVDNLLLL